MSERTDRFRRLIQMRMAAAPRAASEAAEVPRAMAPSFSLGVGGGLV